VSLGLNLGVHKGTNYASMDYTKLLISITEIIDCTSATMKANVFRPPKNPTATQMRNMKPESTRMLARRPSNRMWLHPGVVGENDNYQHTQNKIT